ncbi:pilus assembly protein [Vibrio sinaloensis]|nr:pilus assembly protein [Vibrio sinaloensis]
MRSRKRQQGLAAVELVIGLPVIMLLLLSVTEIARMFVDMNTLTKAVRVGGTLCNDPVRCSGLWTNNVSAKMTSNSWLFMAP